MKKSAMTRGCAALVFFLAGLVACLLAGVPGLSASEMPPPGREVLAAAQPATLASTPEGLSRPAPEAARVAPAPAASTAGITAEGGPASGSDATCRTPVPPPSITGDSPLLRALAGEASRDFEAAPEPVQAPVQLVGPDDDRLLREVERHVNIVPQEPGIRIAEPSYDLPLELNSKVLDYIELFQTTRRTNFEHGLARSRKYEAMMKGIFRELGLPTDLYYLALIESAYNPRAYSSARAMGIWQFIASTGRIYGLRRTAWFDERCDPDKSTRAAAQHMKDLYEELGSWPLVLASYNAGKGRVRREMERAGSRDFWSLELPAQTRNYVPAFYAAMIIAKEPERYGFDVEYETLPASEVIEVGGGTRLSLVAALCDTSEDRIRELNPELRRNGVPPGGGYPLRIPAGTREQLVAGLARIPSRRASGLVSYRVAPGDTLFAIARRFGTTAEAIREANGLKDDQIHAGNRLTLPGAQAAAPIPRLPGAAIASTAVPTVYRVRGGDSLWGIARRFNLSLEDLQVWNDLDADAVLQVGQSLALRESQAGDRSRAAAAGGQTWYEVRKGDNLWQIARRFDATVERIRQANGIGPDNRLRVGDRLLIPQGDDL